MFYKRFSINLLLVAFILMLFNSCSEELDEDIINNEIDLNILNENDWEYSEDIFQLINQHRLSIGKYSLEMDTLYASAYAIEHSKYMIEAEDVNHDNFFNRSNGLLKQGASEVGENIAFGYYSAKSVFNAWLKSESHRRIIEHDYTHVGFGVLRSSINNKYYYTLLFYK